MVMVMIKNFFRTLFQAGILLALLTIVAFISFTNPVFAEYVRPTEPDGPPHTHKLTNFPHAKYAGSHAESSTKILIVTGGDGPLTGVSPIEEKDFWLDVLSEMPEIPSFDVDFIVDWYDGIPTFELLNGYDLVIYDAGGYWYPLRDVTEPLRQYHFSGRPLIVVTPDINWDWDNSGEPVPSFCNDVLHIEGVLGIMDTASYDLYANTGWEIILTPIGVPALSSWPDCFDPKEDAIGTIIQGDIPETEFGVGTCSVLPSYSPYDPEGQLHAAILYRGSSGEGATMTFGFPISGLEDTAVAKRLAQASIVWTLLGKVTIHGFTKDINENKVGGVTVEIYDGMEYYGELPKPIATTTSDGSGWYEFSALTPGYYKLIAHKEGYSGAQIGSNFYSGGIYNRDLVLPPPEYGFITGQMDSLKNSILDVGSQYTEWMSDMTCTVDDTSEEPWEIGLEGIVDMCTDVSKNEGFHTSLTELATGMGKMTWATIWKLIFVQKLEELTEDAGNDVAEIIKPYIFDAESDPHCRFEFELKKLVPYKDVEDSLDSLHNNFESKIKSKIANISDNFCLMKYGAAVASTIGQCQGFEDGNRKYFFPLDLNYQNIQAQDFYSVYNGYEIRRATLEKLNFISDVCTAVNILGDVAIGAGLAAQAVPGPGTAAGGAAIVAGAKAKAISTLVDIPVAVVKAPLSGEFQFYYGRSAVDWADYLSELPKIYESSADFFDIETDTPRYLHKDKSYDAEIMSVDLNPDSYFMNVPILYTKFLGRVSDIHTADVMVENLGYKAKLGMTAEARYKPTIANMILNLLGYPKITIPEGGGFAISNSEKSSGDTFSTSVKYVGMYVDPVDLFMPHHFKVELYTGPFDADIDAVDYWVAPLGSLSGIFPLTDKATLQAKLPARTKASVLTVDTFAQMAAGKTEKHKTKLSPANPEFSQNYSASENTFALRVTLLHPAGIDVNLHAYDPSGAHMGFNKNIGMIENGFTATYTGNRTNPETILIPNATNKSYTIKATLDSTSSNMEEPIVVNIVEIPMREAVLAFAPGCISETPEPGNELTITSNIGEAGGQKDLEEVEVTMDTLSNNEGDTLIHTSQASYTADTIPAGTSNNYTFTFDTPNDAQGQYAGHISISSSNAGTLQQEVFVTIMFDGDANGDGTINVQDVIGIINHILGTDTASGNPDCNEDGNVNVQDVICVINKILGG